MDGIIPLEGKVQSKIKIKENKIVDLFKGSLIDVWKDDTFVYFSTPYAVLNFSEEDWIEFKKDIDKLLGDI